MQINIDVRERELIRSITGIISCVPKFKDISLVTSALPIGDIIFSNSADQTEHLIIERKSIPDLLASIKDGRYSEQSYRLSGLAHPNHDIIYLIEGELFGETPPRPPSSYRSKFTPKTDSSVQDGVCFMPAGTSLKKTKSGSSSSSPRVRPAVIDTRSAESLTTTRELVLSSIFSLNYTKGFSVIRTSTLEETALFLCNSFVKLCQSLARGESRQSALASEKTDAPDADSAPIRSYAHVAQRVKKDNVTPENIDEILLCQIPGISSVSATAMLERFGTFINIVDQLRKNPNCLDGVVVTHKTKSGTRKLNKTVAPAIINYLIAQKTFT